MEYSTLSAEDQKNLTDQTIREIEANHFSNKLALKRAEASGREGEAEVFRSRISELEAEHKAVST